MCIWSKYTAICQASTVISYLIYAALTHCKMFLKANKFEGLDFSMTVYQHSSKPSLKIFPISYLQTHTFSIACWLFFSPPPQKPKLSMINGWQKAIFSGVFDWHSPEYVRDFHSPWGSRSWNWLVCVMGLCLVMAPWEGSSRDIHRPVLWWEGSLICHLLKERCLPHSP